MQFSVPPGLTASLPVSREPHDHNQVSPRNLEPGLYFIPELIDRWKAAEKCLSFIDYDKVEQYRDFGGVRIEDDILVTEDRRRSRGYVIRLR